MKRVVKLIFNSIVGMLLAWTISFLFFYVFSYQLEWFSFQYQRELLAAVSALATWIPYTIYMGVIWYNEALSDCQDRADSFHAGLKKAAILQAFHFFLCLIGVGYPNIDGNLLMFLVGGFTPLTYWIPNIFLASLPILVLNGVLYMAVYAACCRRFHKNDTD